MVRSAGVRRLLDAGYNKKDAFGFYPADLYAQLKTRVTAQRASIYECYRGKIRKELEKNKIFLKTNEELNTEQKRFCDDYFENQLFPILTPMAIDQAHPFPVLGSKTIAFAVSLSRYDKPYMAIVPVPKNVRRLLRLPEEKEETSFILIEQLIAGSLGDLFRGYKITGSALFRVIRDSELLVEEEFTPDLLKAIEEEIRKRPKAKIASLEIHNGCPPDVRDMLCQYLECDPDAVTSSNDDLDVSFLFGLYSQADRPDLHYPSYVSAKPAYDSCFDWIQNGDILLHLPFDSFEPVLDLLKGASTDPDVLGIKMTLYRTDENSGVIAALTEAARNGKQVTVLVEIKARFDEEKNIRWARQLEEAGCHVVYGIPSMKIHAKSILVVRKEGERIRRYVHLSTGNYNEQTSRIYTDIGYFTSNDDFARDISDIFNVITGYSQPSRRKRVIASPTDLRQYFFELIEREIEYQKKYKNGRIIAKLNSLEDPRMIEKLYAASRAGVSVRLLVRGICCLVPGVSDMSETIEVRSIVGRFLEHSRVYQFNNNADPRIFLSSADWMTRNFDRRVELLFEIVHQDLKEKLSSILSTYWKDTAKARTLHSDGTYHYLQEHENASAFSAQDHFLTQP
jgi:polyphosphate kinase